MKQCYVSSHPNHYFKVYTRPDMKYIGDTSIDGRFDFVKQYCTDNQLDPTKMKFHFSFKRKEDQF